MSKRFEQRRHNLRTPLSRAARLGCEVLEQRLVLATVPTGFFDAQLAGDYNRPTSMEIAPDGRIFVTEQGGALRVFKNGTLLATPFVSLTVNSSGERGLLGVTFDPNFTINQYVYVYYTATTPTIHNRVSRFTANGDVAVAGSELVLMDLETLSATNHNGGAIHFGIDGKLYVAVGENAVGTNSQTLNNRLGKMLRINSDGSIPDDNPFYLTASGVNRSIWALGLRNPFTFAVQPGTGRIFINDVGQNTWEEINDGIAGANYGWPTQEGITGNVNFRDPLYAYPHAAGTAGGYAIAGGSFYNPPVNQFPIDYQGDYFYGEYQNDWIGRYDPGTDVSTIFASSAANGLVDLEVDANGALYYLTGANSTATAGKLNLIEYTKVEAAHLFYNNSKFDGGGSGSADDAAIATDKSPLLPGGAATSANYTSYSRGINGLSIDITGANHTPTASDFVFRAGTTGTPTTWAFAPAPSNVTVRAGIGVRGSDRVTITWADGAITNKWLYVQARTTLGLATVQVFYYGNAVGESGTTAGSTTVNSTDEIGARQNPHSFLNPAAIDDAYDFNRDGYVNATDQILARSNSTTAATSLPLISPPALLSDPIASVDDGDVAVGLALSGSVTDDATSFVGAATLWEEDAPATATLGFVERRAPSRGVLSSALHDRMPRRASAIGDDLELPLVDESLCELLASR